MRDAHEAHAMGIERIGCTGHKVRRRSSKQEDDADDERDARQHHVGELYAQRDEVEESEDDGVQRTASSQQEDVDAVKGVDRCCEQSLLCVTACSARAKRCHQRFDQRGSESERREESVEQLGWDTVRMKDAWRHAQRSA